MLRCGTDGSSSSSSPPKLLRFVRMIVVLFFFSFPFTTLLFDLASVFVL